MPNHSATDRLQTSPGQWPHLQTTHDPVPQPPSDGEDLPVDFNNYVRQLQCHEWTMFETHERQFRKSLDTKLLQERAHFACSGDPAKWSKVASILTGVFFQNGIFRKGIDNGGRVWITTPEIRRVGLLSLLGPGFSSEALSQPTATLRRILCSSVSCRKFRLRFAMLTYLTH